MVHSAGSVSLDLAAGTAMVAGVTVPVTPCADGTLLVGDVSGIGGVGGSLTLRHLTFGERTRAALTAATCPDPTTALATTIQAMATTPHPGAGGPRSGDGLGGGPGSGLTMIAGSVDGRFDGATSVDSSDDHGEGTDGAVAAVAQVLALVLAGAAEHANGALGFAETVLLVARATGWTPDQLDSMPAVEVDALARSLVPAENDGWTRLHLASASVGQVRSDLAADLLTRAQPHPISERVARALHPAALPLPPTAPHPTGPPPVSTRHSPATWQPSTAFPGSWAPPSATAPHPGPAKLPPAVPHSLATQHFPWSQHPPAPSPSSPAPGTPPFPATQHPAATRPSTAVLNPSTTANTPTADPSAAGSSAGDSSAAPHLDAGPNSPTRALRWSARLGSPAARPVAADDDAPTATTAAGGITNSTSTAPVTATAAFVERLTPSPATADPIALSVSGGGAATHAGTSGTNAFAAVALRADPRPATDATSGAPSTASAITPASWISGNTGSGGGAGGGRASGHARGGAAGGGLAPDVDGGLAPDVGGGLAAGALADLGITTNGSTGAVAAVATAATGAMSGGFSATDVTFEAWLDDRGAAAVGLPVNGVGAARPPVDWMSAARPPVDEVGAAGQTVNGVGGAGGADGAGWPGVMGDVGGAVDEVAVRLARLLQDEADLRGMAP